MTNYPSIFRQTEFDCGQFVFPNQPVPKHRGICHFNPSIVQFKDGLVLFTRRCTHWKDNPMRQGFSDLCIHRVGADKTLSHPIVPAFHCRTQSNQWEDPRTIQHDGHLYLSVANWNMPSTRVIRQTVYKAPVSDLSEFAEVCSPAVGQNGSAWEKNWTWFFAEGAWHLVYTISPYAVYRMTPNWSAKRLVSGPTFSWQYGLPRGGSNPVLDGHRFVSFFHSSLPWKGHQRRYFMGAYTFEAKSPFRINGFTTKPILVGSENDTRDLGGPCVVFPCGAVKQQQNWLVVFGINDENCGWIEIPPSSLDEMITKV